MTPARQAKSLLEALELHKAGKLAQARALYARVLAAAPNHFDAAHLGGTAALQDGDAAGAAELLGRARRLNPKSAVCALRLGACLNATGRHAQAEKELRAALALEPGLAEAWFHLSGSLEQLGRVYEAIDATSRAIAARADYSEAHDHLGRLLIAVKGHGLAEPHFRKAVAIDPHFARGFCNLGICLTYLGKFTEALACLDRALALDPEMNHVHAGRGVVLERCHRLPEALEAYRRAIVGNPQNLEARSARLLALHYSDEVDRDAIFREHVEFGESVGGAHCPLHARAIPESIERARDSALHPGAPVGSAVRPESSTDSSIAPRRLKLGFVSPNLRIHSVAFFLEPLLAHLDASRFEVYLYHDHPVTDAMSERLRSHAAYWRSVAGQPLGALEALIRSDALDILVDLAGHTDLNRLPLFARRVAPVQVSYLGYPDTTGLREMDYRLVDAITDPPGEADRHCTEKLIRFAPTAWCYAPPKDAPEPTRSTQEPITFGCFNNFAKVTDTTLAAWGRLLAAVPASRLLVKSYGLGDATLRAAAIRRMESAGIPADRVELLERIAGQGSHLAAYGRMDVALDTYPYNGTTTTCEALWMGVPVVTLAGNTHASRVGLSLLAAVGHSEWVAESWTDYVAKAAALAADAEGRSHLRAGLREQMQASALMEHEGQAARFGAALEGLVPSTQAPEPVAISE